MKRIIKNILPIITAGILFSACNKDFLNTQPLDKPPASVVWADPSLSEAFVTDIYNVYHDGILNQESMDCISDNALYNFGRAAIMEGNISPDVPGWVNNTYEWGEMYLRIRATNLALENLATASFDASLVDRLKGEVYFLRGHCYNQLLRYYGGIPLIKSSYSLTTPDFSIARNTYEECVNSIVSDLDSAALLLDGKTLGLGRATKDAAMALKARVLLYAASDLHDQTKAKAKSTLLAGFGNYELLGYTSGDQKTRWEKARDAAKAVIDLGKYGYKLDLAAPSSKDQAITDYTDISLSRNGGEKETILAKYYINASTDDWGAWYPRNNTTNGYHGWTSSEPTQNLVDNYEMMDGTKFSWSNTAHAAAPYENREARFYASIFYDGAKWKPRTTDGAGTDPYGEIQFGTYEVGTAGSATTYFGLDTRNSPIENWNGTRTGYSIRRFSNDNVSIVDMNQKQQIPSIQIRYTEVIFNYVEALLELGDEATAKQWLQKIRFRAGLPAFTETGSALMERYRNERNIEMLFEEQRFYDSRRWMIAPATQGEKVRIMVITGKLKAGKTVTTYRYDKNNYDYTYKVQNIESGVENRAWDDKLYFPPIKQPEMDKNDKLIQNPGY
ncbi:MAG: RagB/SusD family nutrient uptake outer membrane protein [Chitinophagaceae bacterium]|nr:RagB/SusD family nutrient uptake outer membrane protein [Chitinophagaceae bacterium]